VNSPSLLPNPASESPDNQEPVTPGSPSSGFPGPWVICFLLALAAVGSILLQRQLWSLPFQTLAADAGSVDNILRHLGHVAKAPHPTGSPEHRTVRDYISNQLASAGYAVEIQREEILGPVSTNHFVLADLHNIMARLPGAGASGALLVACHYDTAPLSPGAADDGYAVASMLEVARLMASGPRPKHDIIFLFTDGEELGLLGAETFLRHSWSNEVVSVLNFDSRGTAGPIILFESTPNNGAMIRSASRVGTRLVGVSIAEEVYRRMPNSTDFTVFRRAGLAGLNFANIHGAAHYHTALDNLNHVNRRTVEHLFGNMLALTREFASALPENSEEKRLFFDLAGVMFFSYPISWSIPLAIVTTAFYGILLLQFRRAERFSFKAVAASSVLQLLAAALAWALVAGLMLIWRKFWEAKAGAFFELYREPFYMAGYSLLVIAFTIGVTGWMTRRLGGVNVAFGVLLVWNGLLWASALLLVNATYFFLVAVLTLQAAVWTSRIGNPRIAGLSAVLLSVPVVMMIATTVALLFVAAGLRASAVLAPLISLSSALVLLPIHPNDSRGLRRFSGGALIGALASLICAIVLNQPSRLHPKPYAMAYLGDPSSGKGYLLLADERPEPWQREFFPALSNREPIEEYLPWRRGTAWLAEKESLRLPAPTVDLVGTETAEGVRRVTLNLQSHRAASSVYLVLNSTQISKLTAGRSNIVFTPGARETTILQFTGPASVPITIDLKDNSPCEVTVYDQTHGLPAPFAPKRDDVTPAHRRGFSESVFLRHRAVF
jgi:hypothetical protein